VTAPLRVVRSYDLEIAAMREEDRRVRRGYAVGVGVGLLLWLAVFVFCWATVELAGMLNRVAVSTDGQRQERSVPEPEALRRGRTPAP
jgi:hypothetical protein